MNQTEAQPAVSARPPLWRRLLGWLLLLPIAVVLAWAWLVVEAGAETRTEGRDRLLGAGLAVGALALWLLSGMLRRRRALGVVQLVGLALVSFLGMVLGNVLLARGSPAREKRSIADVRNLGNAVLSYATDSEHCPPAADLAGLAEHLVPRYIQEVPREDGLRYPYRYEVVKVGGAEECLVGSSGKGGEWELPHLADYMPRPRDSLDDDIVWRHGLFVRPGGEP